MSQHTEFRGRGRNHWFSPDGDGYISSEQRFKFVKGTTLPNGVGVKCGEGTYFPFKMTLDQIIEVYYRVRDSKFTQGSNAYRLQGTQPTNQFGWSPLANFPANARGLYLNSENEEDPPAEYDYLFSDKYGPSESYKPCRDAIHPHAMWPVWPDVKLEEAQDSDWYSPIGDGHGTTLCGFSTFTRTVNFDDPDNTLYGLTLWRYDAEEEEDQQISTISYFQTSGQVAWVGGDSPDDPGVEFYLGCRFWCEIPNGTYRVESLYSGQAGFPSEGTVFETKFTLKLRTGEEFTTGLFDAEAEDNRGGTIVLEATKWWPYATKDGVTPIWSETTGLQINPATA